MRFIARSLNVMTIAGTILGNVLVWALCRPDRIWPLIGAFIVLNIGCLALTLWRVRKPPASGASEPLSSSCNEAKLYFLVAGNRFEMTISDF